MAIDEAPKSAYDLAMERLRQRDRDEGLESRPLTDEQKARIADARGFYEAKLAEREILHQSEKSRARSHEEIETLENDYRRDRERLIAERDGKLEDIRRG
jgi:hypothetical protein